jgi:hypothetical protein
MIHMFRMPGVPVLLWLLLLLLQSQTLQCKHYYTLFAILNPAHRSLKVARNELSSQYHDSAE